MELNQEGSDDQSPQKWLPTASPFPHNHPYLRWLRGEVKEVDIPVEGLPSQDATEEPNTKINQSVDDTLEVLLKDWSQDWSTNMKNEHLRFPWDEPKGNSATMVARFICNSCSHIVDSTGVLFFCKSCRIAGDFFMLCGNCATSGSRCLVPDHEPQLMKSVEIAFNLLARVPAKSIHSIPKDRRKGFLPSVDTMNMPHTNLGAVIRAYLSESLRNTDLSCRSGTNLSIYRLKDDSADSGPDGNMITSFVHQWRLICHFLAHEHYDPSIRRLLTPEHLEVIKLLLEWWNGDIQDFRLTQMALRGTLIQNLFPATSLPDFATLVGTTRSEYQKAMLDLFLLEFGKDPGPPILRLQRAEASRQASVQRLGFSYVRRNMVPLWQKPGELMYETAWKRLNSICRSPWPGQTTCEEKDARETFRFTVEMLTAFHDAMDLAMQNLRSARQILGPQRLIASIDPCGWIPQAKKMVHVPYYLWDKQDQQTVCTENFIHLPEYTVVSHTWGRWKIKNAEDIALPGIPWKIPQNTRFRVQSLPEILGKVPGHGRYVWFDLVCIPQSTDDVLLKSIEKQEIANQAAVFSHAETAVVWLNAIDDFGPLEDICHMLAMNVLRYPGPFDNARLKECLENLSRLNKKLINEPLLTPLAQAGVKPSQGFQRWDKVLDEWFSSLWTLQEACMRPDMWLCTRDWKPLESHASGTPIPLDCVLSLARLNAEHLLPEANKLFAHPEISATKALPGLVFNEQESHESAKLIISPPSCLYNFVLYASVAALIDIPGIEPIRIITMSNQRECKRNRRAEAIMSVMDVTVWFEGHTSSQQNGDKVILDRFPMLFVTEVREKLGDFDFFSSDIARDFWPNLNADPTSRSQLEGLKVRGTLLPFSEDRSRDILQLTLGNDPLTDRTLETHHTVCTWLIKADGSVTLPKANILMSSSDDSIHHDLTFNVIDYHDITATGQRLFSSSRIRVSMKDWLFKRRYQCYAVALQRTKSSGAPICLFSGIILRAVEPGVLIKSGNFVTDWWREDDYGWSDSQDTDWLVL